MKLIRGSKTEETQEFSCKHCGAEFSAERGEYTQEFGEEREHIGWEKKFFGLMDSEFALRRVTPSFYFTVICPVCKNEIYKHFPTGEKPYVEVR